MIKKNHPAHRIRYGAITATIWENDGLDRSFFNTTFRRVYKKQDDTWSETDSFDDRDLPTLAKAAGDAHSWIQAARRDALGESEAEDETGDHEDE